MDIGHLRTSEGRPASLSASAPARRPTAPMKGVPRPGCSNSADAPPQWLLLLSFSVLVGLAILAGLRVWGWWMDRSSLHQGERPRKQQGFLSPREAALRYGEQAARREAVRLHPSLTPSELRQRPIAELAIPLGRCGRFPVFASLEHAVAVLAGMRQGKTTGLRARIALHHRGSLVYTTTKPDDLRLFYKPPPGSHSRTFPFNPDDLGGLGTVGNRQAVRGGAYDCAPQPAKEGTPPC